MGEVGVSVFYVLILWEGCVYVPVLNKNEEDEGVSGMLGIKMNSLERLS